MWHIHPLLPVPLFLVKRQLPPLPPQKKKFTLSSSSPISREKTPNPALTFFFFLFRHPLCSASLSHLQPPLATPPSPLRQADNATSHHLGEARRSTCRLTSPRGDWSANSKTKLTWDGILTVKSAYGLGMLGKEGGDGVLAAGGLEDCWTRIWAMDALPKIKHLLWRFCQGCVRDVRATSSPSYQKL